MQWTFPQRLSGSSVQNEEEMKNMRWCTWSWQSYKRAIFCSLMLSHEWKNCSIYSIPTFPTQLNWIVASFNNFVIMFLCSSIATVFLNKCSSSLLTSLRFSPFVVQTVNAVAAVWKSFPVYTLIYSTLYPGFFKLSWNELTE